jgi:hypothetical protein
MNKEQLLQSTQADLQKVKDGLFVMNKFDTLEFKPDTFSKMKTLQKELTIKVEELKLDLYKDTIKQNFYQGKFRVKEDKMKIILEDEILRELVVNKYILEAKIAALSFSIKIDMKPTDKKLKTFLSSIKN